MTDVWCEFMCPRLILEFDVRTKEDSGLLLYMARVNHADFVAVQVTWDFDVSRPVWIPVMQ